MDVIVSIEDAIGATEPPPPETRAAGEAPLVQRPYEVRAEMKVRHVELKSISERLDHVAETSRAKKWELTAEVMLGAFGAGVLGLIPFFASKPSATLVVGYFLLLAAVGAIGRICWSAGKDVASERVDSILAIKEHIDKTMLRTETPRLQAPTRRLGPSRHSPEAEASRADRSPPHSSRGED